MPRTIVLSRSDKDLSAASSFGEIEYIFERPPSPFKVDDLVHGVLNRLEEIAFDAEEDFIVMTGPPDRLATLMGTICVNYEGPFRILIFDASSHQYSLRIFRPVPDESPEYVG